MTCLTPASESAWLTKSGTLGLLLVLLRISPGRLHRVRSKHCDETRYNMGRSSSLAFPKVARKRLRCGVEVFQTPMGTRIWYVVPAIIVHQKLPSRCNSEQSVADVTMPGKADGKKRKPTFNTIEREESFNKPPKSSSTYPILHEFVTPHIESFNALFDDSGLPKGDGDGKGLISIGIKDIGERVVFDGTGQIGTESGQAGWGNRLSSE